MVSNYFELTWSEKDTSSVLQKEFTAPIYHLKKHCYLYFYITFCNE